MQELVMLWQHDPDFVVSLLLLTWLGYVWPVEVASRNLFVPYLAGYSLFLGYSLIGNAAIVLLVAPLLPALLPWRIELDNRRSSMPRPRREDRGEWQTRIFQVSVDVAGMACGCLLHTALFSGVDVLQRPFPLQDPASLWRYLLFIVPLLVLVTLSSAALEFLLAGRQPFAGSRLAVWRKYSPRNEIFGLFFIAAGPLQYLVYFFYQFRGPDLVSLFIAGTWTLLLNYAFTIWGRRGIRLTDSTRELDLARRVVRLGDDAARIVHRVRHEVALIGIGISRLRKQMGALDPAQAALLSAEIDRLEAVRRNLQQATVAGEAAGSTDAGNAELETVLAHQVALLQVKALEQGVALQLHPVDTGGLLLSDPALFGEALFNVIENAVSAARARVDIHGYRLGDRVEIRVEDDGPGMPEADLPRAFEPFFTGKPDGSGMGLVIARGAVENERGTIRLANMTDAESRVLGMRASISLPAAASRSG